MQNVGARYGWPASRDVCEADCPAFVPGPDACTNSCPCGEGEGDCDSDADCEDGLTCVQNVGTNYGWPSTRDVCERDQVIIFTKVPPLGSLENLEGKVRQVNPANYKVAVYIKVGSLWWPKPYFSRPLTNIQTNGTWVTDISTGGRDQSATKIAAFLFPNSYVPESYKTYRDTLPKVLYQKAFSYITAARSP